ncbi:MAG: 30S ribosomal protein S2 [Candidatus Gracilibacteria bacterium]|jgi:small subunit ribosomal protein S2|nr:30S ribosomal protein S2 [Candidatus Gracilibacteria bacterium]
MKEISVREMLANAVHFGHKKTTWNPKMKTYIHGAMGDVHVFDLNKTAKALKEACDFLNRASREGKTILFVSTKPQTKVLFEEFQKEVGVPIIVNKWIGGLLTNQKTISARIRKFKDLKEMVKTGEIEKFTKKEQAKLKKDLEKLEEAFGGIEKMHRKPDVMFVVDGKRDKNALKEAEILGIPVVGICDSNADPDLYDLAVPANDDAISSLTYILSFIFDAVKEGKNKSNR